MARAMWSGDITCGLLTVPAKVYTATDEPGLTFHTYEKGTTDRIKLRKVNARTGDEVTETVRGYDDDGGALVQLTADEYDKATEVQGSKSFTIERFVDIADVDTRYFDRLYNVAPDLGDRNRKRDGRTFAVLLAALTDMQKAAIGQIAFRGRIHLAVVVPHGDRLVLHTLHWAENVRDTGDLPVSPELSDWSALDGARGLIESMSGKWEPEMFRDEQTESLRELVAEKRGKLVKLPDTVAADAQADVMALIAEIDAGMEVA